MNRAIVAGVLALFPFGALADDGIGRYQALAIPETANTVSASTILFLDTRDGHVWEWRNAHTMDDKASAGEFTYIGKLIPGGTSPTQLKPRQRVDKCFTFNEKQFCE